MKIRPLHKRQKGHYESDDKCWRFIEWGVGERNWSAYQKMLDGKFYFDTPYFFESYKTLRSLIKAIEKAKP